MTSKHVRIRKGSTPASGTTEKGVFVLGNHLIGYEKENDPYISLCKIESPAPGAIGSTDSLSTSSHTPTVLTMR